MGGRCLRCCQGAGQVPVMPGARRPAVPGVGTEPGRGDGARVQVRGGSGCWRDALVDGGDPLRGGVATSSPGGSAGLCKASKHSGVSRSWVTPCDAAQVPPKRQPAPRAMLLPLSTHQPPRPAMGSPSWGRGAETPLPSLQAVHPPPGQGSSVRAAGTPGCHLCRRVMLVVPATSCCPGWD